MTWTIRQATEEDLPAITELEHQIYTAEIPWSLEAYQEDFAQPERLYLVAVDGEKIVGYAAAGIIDERAEILVFTVEPDYRRQGMASAFFDRLLAWTGDREVILQTRTDNQEMSEFCNKYGFTLNQVLLDYYSPGVDAYEMQKVVA